ncbi:hypothetical protein LCGC14_1126930 [marine sediment metagenome]|uniref:Right handed beta helix domain-containing protein n=1 Tax=marine sediment metagenome TaxID=412755 RepID=A0A0F9M2B8_9ZZZZ
MKRLCIIGILCLFLIPLLSNGQVKITGKSTGTVTRTNINAVDGKSTLEDGSNKIRVADPFYSSQTLTVNSTTPSIASYSAFKTANSATTAITTLNGISDSTYIKVVFIRIGDANTSFVNSSTFDCNGTDLSPSSGDLIRAVWSGLASPNGKWLVEKLDSYTFEDMRIRKGMVYDVTHPHYGAIVGDLVSDVAAIQEAADSIAADGGGTLFFPPGQYEWYGGNVILYSNTTVSAFGAVFNDTTGGDVFFTINGDSDIVFLGGEFDGNADTDGGYTEHNHGISIINAFRVTVKHTYMHNLAGDGVYIADSDGCIIINNRLIMTHLQDAPYIGRNGVAIVEGDNTIVSNNILEGGAPAGVDIEPNAGLAVTNVLVTGNIINGGVYGLSVTGGAASASADSIKLIDNLISYTAQYGIRIQESTHWTIVGNEINSSGYDGILIRSGPNSPGVIDDNDIYYSGTQTGGDDAYGIIFNSGLENITVTNNRISYSERDGIRVGSTSGSESSHFTIKDNICWNNDRNDNSTYAGIYILYLDSSLVSGNYCYDDDATPTQAYGFHFDNMDDCTISDNHGINNKTRLNFFTTMTKERLGGIVAYSWSVDNVAASTSNTTMFIAGGAMGNFTVPFDCQIISLSVATSTAVTADTILVNVETNESIAGFGDVLDGDGGDAQYTVLTLLDDSDSDLLLSAGDRIRVIYSSSGSLLPNGSLDMIATILVRY